MISPKNFYMSITPFRVGQSNTLFTFSSFILIFSSLITTSKNLSFLTFHLYFSSLTYKSFSVNLFTTFSTTSSCYSFSSVPTIIFSMKLLTAPVLIKFHRISFITVWNIAGKFVSIKNIAVSSNVSQTSFSLYLHN